MMKAVVYERYGSPDVLEIKEIPIPNPKANEVLIKVFATTVTAGDWRLRKADPFLARIFNGLFKPKRVKVLGFELSGIVEQVGKNVDAYKPGDAVFAHCGLRFGGYAEYACLPANELIALKPSTISFEEAAAIPVGGLTAYRFLKQSGLVKGNRILIYGASGSVGTYAVQIAKVFGAEVTAVCSTSNLQLASRLGADHVIDYTTSDFTSTPATYDIIFDAVGKTSKSKCAPLLDAKGTFVSVRTNPKTNPGDMLALKSMIESGQVKAIIDRVYRLDQIREAHAYAESFRKKGNVVVKINDL